MADLSELANEESPDAVALDPVITPDAAVRELLHGFRNHLQVIVSLLALQANAAEYDEHIQLFREIHNRVQAVAAVYEQLQPGQNVSTVHVGACLRNLARDVAASFDAKPELQLRESLADLALDVDQALPLALVTNELLCNAFQRALSDSRIGEISLELRYIDRGDESPEWGELDVSDDGAGPPDNAGWFSAESTSLRICRSLVKQLGGSMELQTSPGRRCGVSFPLAKNSPSV